MKRVQSIVFPGTSKSFGNRCNSRNNSPAETGYVAAALQTPSRDWKRAISALSYMMAVEKKSSGFTDRNDWSADELPVGLYTIVKAETADGS